MSTNENETAGFTVNVGPRTEATQGRYWAEVGQGRGIWSSLFNRTPAVQEPRTRPVYIAPERPPRPTEVISPIADSKVVFGDALEVGSVVLVNCSGSRCDQGTVHALDRPKLHELTIVTLRKTTSMVLAVAVDEDGNQQPFEAIISRPARVKA